jgi:hypothetical protein
MQKTTIMLSSNAQHGSQQHRTFRFSDNERTNDICFRQQQTTYCQPVASDNGLQCCVSQHSRNHLIQYVQSNLQFDTLTWLSNTSATDVYHMYKQYWSQTKGQGKSLLDFQQVLGVTLIQSGTTAKHCVFCQVLSQRHARPYYVLTDLQLIRNVERHSIQYTNKICT